MQPNVVVPSRNDVQCNTSRYLPTYDAANTQYTMRLPTYRSSYIRRFHPYARIPRFLEEKELYDSDNDLYDEGTPLDLRILGNPVELQLPTTADDRIEGALNKVPTEESPTSGVPLIVTPSTGNPDDLRRTTR